MKAWLTVLLVSTTMAGAALADDIDYLRDIKPLLAQKCSSCHGALKQESELRLDAGSLIRAGGANGLVVEPGNASESELIVRISASDLDLRMPPPDGFAEPVTADQIDLLKKWIDQGADYSQHWAFVQPTQVELPPVKATDWPTDSPTTPTTLFPSFACSSGVIL